MNFLSCLDAHLKRFCMIKNLGSFWSFDFICQVLRPIVFKLQNAARGAAGRQATAAKKGSGSERLVGRVVGISRVGMNEN